MASLDELRADLLRRLAKFLPMEESSTAATSSLSTTSSTKRTAAAPLAPIATTTPKLVSDPVLEQQMTKPSSSLVFSAGQVVGDGGPHADAVFAAAMPTRCSMVGPAANVGNDQVVVVSPSCGNVDTDMSAEVLTHVGGLPLFQELELGYVGELWRWHDNKYARIEKRNPGVCNQLNREELSSELLEQHNRGENISSGSKNSDLCAAWVTGENFLARPSSDFVSFCGDSSRDLVMLSISLPWDPGVFNELGTTVLQSELVKQQTSGQLLITTYPCDSVARCLFTYVVCSNFRRFGMQATCVVCVHLTHLSAVVWSSVENMLTKLSAARVLNMSAYDAILGIDWLAAQGDMYCNWKTQTLKFQHKGSEIILKGIHPSAGDSAEVSMEQVMKWRKGNDIWALALLETDDKEQTHDVPHEIQKMLAEFSTVFSEPKSLPPTRVYDHATELSSEVLNLLELQDIAEAQQLFLSCNALSGASEGNTVQIRALVQNQVMLILIDTGSSHSFISPAFVERLQCPLASIPEVTVRVANNEIMHCDKMVQQMSWWTHGETFEHDMCVLPLGAYDAILGIDWVALQGDMFCNWKNKTLQFQHKGKEITLKGLSPVLRRWQCSNPAGADQMGGLQLQHGKIFTSARPSFLTQLLGHKQFFQRRVM